MRERRWAMLVIVLGLIVAVLDGSIMNLALPTVAKQLNASPAEAIWIINAYQLGTLGLLLPLAALGERIGYRKVYLIGLVCFTLASAVAMLAQSLWLLIAARGLQGMGAAGVMAVNAALVRLTYPAAKLGKGMALNSLVVAVSAMAGPTVSALILSVASWPWLFALNLPLGVLALFLAYRTLPVDGPKAERVGFDYAGTLLLALSLGAYALAMTLGRGSFGLLNAVLLLAAVLGAGLFVRVQKRATFPLVRLALFRDVNLRAGLAMGTLVSTVMMATLVVGPFYLARALGLDAAMVGLVLAAGPVAAALTGVPAGKLADRFGAQRMTAVGLAVALVGCAALALLPTALGIPGYIDPIVLVTVGYALFQTANNTAVMAGVRADQRGVISGLLGLSRNLGLVTGASLMGAVFAYAVAVPDITTAQPEAVAWGLRVTFAVATVLVAFALVLALAWRSRARGVV